VKKNAVSQVQVEKDEASVLTQRQSIQSRHNSIALFGSQEKTYQANLALIDAKIAQAEIDLTNTVIRAPFPARFGQVNIEPGQFLNASEQLFEAYANSLTEIPVQISAARGRLLFPPGVTNTIGEDMNMERLRELVKITAVVRADAYGPGAQWPGRFARVRESVDVKTRMLSIVIAVDNPFSQAIPGRRPPLTKGVYCEVELSGPMRKGLPVVPRNAVRDGKVFVLDAEHRLRSRAIRLDFENGDYAAIASGLAGGETIVVSDPTPAIEGMLVDPVTDEAALAYLTAEAEGDKGKD
jgi:membrane fusion protein, multidrug efflux system